MGNGGNCLAIDWGTSNRRLFLLARDGTPVRVERDGRGALAMARDDYPAEIDRLRARFGIGDVIAAGMVGSTRGWVDIPYVPVSAGLAEVAAGTVEAALGVRLVPGLSIAGARHDVMRGEETQVLGAIENGCLPPDALACQPGTHNKWITVANGRIVDFRTTMTGEMFGTLKATGTLAGLLDGAVEGGAGFDEGLARAGAGQDLTSALFEVRARVLLGATPVADAASLASGILIGADVAAQGDLRDRDVHVIGAGPLAALYTIAIERAGGRALPIDAEAAFAAGIHAIRSRLS